jgi:hypothetical protein
MSLSSHRGAAAHVSQGHHVEVAHDRPQKHFGMAVMAARPADPAINSAMSTQHDAGG